MREKVIKYWPVAAVISITFFLRIIRLEELFYFTYDESIPAFVGRRLILWHHVPLIGGVTPFNFHLGPYFYWFYAAVLFLAKLNPISWGFASAAIATITTFLIFFVGKTFGSKRVAISSAILWTFSYLATLHDRHLWALYWGPLISLISLISLYKIIKGNHNFVYLLGATIALSIHADPSNLVFLALSLIVWLVYKLPVKKSTFVALGLILFSFLPLVVFDIRHNFANTRPVFDFIKQGNNDPGFEANKFADNLLLFPRTFTRSIYIFGDSEISKQYSYCRNYVAEKFSAIPAIFILLASLILIIFIAKNIRKKTNNPGWQLMSLLIILYFLGIQLYGTVFRADIFEHYITGLFPILLLISAHLISKLPQKLWFLALAIFVGFNLYKVLIAKNSMGLTAKRQAIEYTLQQVEDKEFSLDSLSTCWKYNGYRYLFAVFGKEPVKSYVDPNFAYLYGTTPVAEKHPETVVAFIVHDFEQETAEFYKKYAFLKSHEISSSTFGNIEVVIMDNSIGWFD